MVSLLEGVPYDVLLQVAFLAAAASFPAPPSALSSLLLTSKRIHRELNVEASPQLYADLFHYHFDPPKFFPSTRGIIPATLLAREYVARHKVLRRSKLCTWVQQELLDDMRCALRMVFESNGLNEMHLAADAFPSSLLGLVEAQLPGGGEGYATELKSLLVWHLYLSLSRADIVQISTERLSQIPSLLHGFVVTSTVASKNRWFSDLATFFCHSGLALAGHSRLKTVHRIEKRHALSHHLSAVQPCYAAMMVIFALQEMCPIAIPPHLPETRAIAMANNVNGPTQQDMREFQNFRTPLFADAIPRNHLAAPFNIPNRCSSHDPGFLELFGVERPEGDAIHPYRPGAFAGLWKGSIMFCKSEDDISDEKDFFNRRPLQVVLRAYHCFAPHKPLALSRDETGFDSFPFQPWDMQDVHGLQQLLEQHHYIDASPSANASGTSSATRHLAGHSQSEFHQQVVDTILFGETTDEYDQAWKGFRYIGRIQKDGLVLLKRKPKQAAEEYLGVNLFEGRLMFGQTFVGRWRHSDDPRARGIFALAKVEVAS